MGRPKGSTNKPKVVVSMAGEAYIPLKPPKGLQKAFEEVVIKDAEECIQEAKQIIYGGKKKIEGWVNVYKHIGDYCTNFFCGSDIHPTKESATSNAQKGSLGQVFISVEDK